ncbi:hypothetical protein BC941DRAFT_442063 [Chlamydoabsidia padenii]|nr:hypothetical protein BC941DRAFT_442063 [Chlamydoabsidia padenii]
MVVGKSMNEEARFALFGEFFDMVKVNTMCKKRKMELDNKFIIPSGGFVHIQAKGCKPPSSSNQEQQTQSAKDTQKSSQSDKNLHWNTIADLKKKTTQLCADTKEVNKPISNNMTDGVTTRPYSVFTLANYNNAQENSNWFQDISTGCIWCNRSW